jgi:hypothetical protein
VIKINRKQEELLFDALTKLKMDMEENEARRKVKLFIPLNNDTTLLEMLSRQPKGFLDDLRKNLMLPGVSTLKKAELSKVLDKEIKQQLKSTIMELDMSSYHIMQKVALGDGFIKETEELSIKLKELYQLGLIYPALKEEYGMCYVIPSDTIEAVKNLINDFEVISLIKLSDKICNISRGILFFYGVLDTTTLYNMVVKYLGIKNESSNLDEIIFRNIARVNEFENDYYYNPEVLDPEYVIKEQDKRATIPYLSLTLKDVMTAGKEGYMAPWNQYDKKLYDFILGNFEITPEEASEEIDSIIDDFKNGDNFNDTIKSLGECYDFRDLEQLQEMTDLLVLQYNNCKQYILKGHSPLELKPKNKSVQGTKASEKTKTQISNIKIGRNDPCPCGSGKKYKNCCLNKDK